MRLHCLSPAKLNLFLHITGRRSDGYHELQTLFQFLDYADELSFESRDDGIIELKDSIEGVADEENLIVKAALILQKYHTSQVTKPGVTIGLKKNLPMGGGLGGGSSNAATTILALNELWNMQLSQFEMQKIGLSLGADVPVFIHGRTCLAEGIGEEFSPVEVVESWYLVLIPDCKVNTGEIFSDPALTRNSKTFRIRASLTWEDLGKLKNDCETVAKAKYPEINQALTWLSQYGIARMTGTGCCVFSAFSTEEKAKNIASKRPDGLKAFVARGVNQSPACRAINP